MKYKNIELHTKDIKNEKLEISFEYKGKSFGKIYDKNDKSFKHIQKHFQATVDLLLDTSQKQRVKRLFSI